MTIHEFPMVNPTRTGSRLVSNGVPVPLVAWEFNPAISRVVGLGCSTLAVLAREGRRPVTVAESYDGGTTFVAVGTKFING